MYEDEYEPVNRPMIAVGFVIAGISGAAMAILLVLILNILR